MNERMKIVLTGIKPTGTPHIGNYFGAIKPAIDMCANKEHRYFFFIADYHALNTIDNPEDLRKYTAQVACAWLACGLNPEQVTFYRQSDIPEIFELFWILTNMVPKSMMNLAHAYKASVAKNQEEGKSGDDGVNMGLYNYPILMAADILLFNSGFVPVGEDQRQHVEFARDFAQFFNKRYGNSLVVPDAVIQKETAVLLGHDGRKMSKSYNNAIELFCPEKQLKKRIMSIVTDSTGVDEPKSTSSTVFKYYRMFSTPEETEEMAKQFNVGISWGQAKTCLFEKANEYIKPLRENYERYMNNPDLVNDILLKGAERARPIANETIRRVRKAIGVEIR